MQREELHSSVVEAQPPVVEAQPPVVEAQPNTTFGYDNDFLSSLGIEPAILLELPEDLRIELMASFDLPPI